MDKFWRNLSLALERQVARTSAVLAWITVMALVLTCVVDVLARQLFRFGSEGINTLEAGLFMGMVMLFLGDAYLRDAHVRIDILREKMSPRGIAWIELLGNLVVLIPICVILIYDGAEAAFSAFRQGEGFEAFNGPSIMWFVKITVPCGFLLLLGASVSASIRNILFLCGKAPAPAPRAGGEDC